MSCLCQNFHKAALANRWKWGLSKTVEINRRKAVQLDDHPVLGFPKQQDNYQAYLGLVGKVNLQMK